MGTRLNIFTQQEQVEFIPVSLCHDLFIKYRHYCLSLGRQNDMKIIIVQECHGLSWNLQTFYSIGEDKVKCALYQFHSTFSSWSSSWYNSNKNKRNSEKHTEIFLEFFGFLEQANKREKQKQEKLFIRESSQQAKEEQEIFLGFLFNYYYYSKKVNQLKAITNFFVFLKVYQTHKKKARKRK